MLSELTAQHAVGAVCTHHQIDPIELAGVTDLGREAEIRAEALRPITQDLEQGATADG
jgi:hypothetical protein